MFSYRKQQYIVESKDIREVVDKVKTILEVEKIVEEVFLELGIEGAEYGIEWFERDRTFNVYIVIDTSCRKEIEGRGYRIRVLCGRYQARNLNIYRSIALELSKISASLLLRYIDMDTEYMAIVLDQGVAVVLEGFREKVVVPQLPGELFICHTHPNTSAHVFSEKDIGALIDVLSYGGIGGAVVSRLGCFTIYRRGMFVVEDYFKLLNLAREYGYINIDIMKTQSFRSIAGEIFVV